jgi:L-fuculose-phosphate aldolase
MNQPMLKRQVVEYCQLLWQKGWVGNHDGNITVRLDGGKILATPTAFSKRVIKEDDLLVVELSSGKVLQGRHNVFSELYLHTEFYQARPDVQAVIHAHPTTLCSFAAAGLEVEPRITPEAVVSLGTRIPLAPPVQPKSLAAKHQLRSLAPLFDVILLGAHGPVAAGTDLEQAFLRLELAEHLANIQQKAIWLGGCRFIPEAWLEDLLKARKKAGLGPEARGAKTPQGVSLTNSPIDELIKAMVSSVK